MLRCQPPACLPSAAMKIAHSMPDIRHMLNHNWDTRQSSRLEISNSDRLDQATLPLLLSTGLTAIFVTAAFAIWWWLLR